MPSHLATYLPPQAGLYAGLTLVAVNGEDVTTASPVRVLKILSIAFMSPTQQRGSIALRVVPTSMRLSHLWAATAPRHVLLRTAAALSEVKQGSDAAATVADRFGIYALAGASRETMAFVSRVASDTPAGMGAVQIADRIAAINGVKLFGVTYGVWAVRALLLLPLSMAQPSPAFSHLHFPFSLSLSLSLSPPTPPPSSTPLPTTETLQKTLVNHAASSRFLILELHAGHAGYGLFQPREVTVTRTSVTGSELGVFGFVVAGATTRPNDRRRAAGVYVWHVHEPALCGQLVPGDRILQVRNNMTTLSTVRDVHRPLQQGSPELQLTVRNDPAGYSALKAEIGESGSSADGLLSQRLLDAGLSLESPTPESLAMHPGASTPVASAHFGAARASRNGPLGSTVELRTRTVLERMHNRVLSEQSANMKVG